MMEWVILGMTLAFALALALKRVFPRLCGVCFAVTGTWLVLLALYWTQLLHDPLPLALLMGGSAVAGYFWIEARLVERTRVFRLPVLLTLLLAAISLIDPRMLEGWWALALIWALFLVLHAARVPAVRKMAVAVIDCCRRW